MKVTGTNGVGSAGGPRQTRPAADGSGFRLVPTDAPAAAGQATSVTAPTGVMGMAALLALQDVGGPLERRRRSVRRAGRILDVLDEVKVALLGGDLSSGELDRLRLAVRDERARTDDANLEAVLDEVELRAAVELAKLEQSHRAA